MTVHDIGFEDPSSRRPLRLVLAGASGDNSNLGVSALMHSVLAAASRWAPASSVTVLDNGRGARPAQALVDGSDVAYTRCGVRLSRRFHQRESLWNIRLSSRLGGLGNPASSAMLDADVVLDVSGGDSFTDLYGAKRFRTVVGIKRAALASRAPLVLLPQTYGPFTEASSARAAADVLQKAQAAFARDEASFDTMVSLLGPAFDERRHRVGVDMAFALEVHEPPAEVQDWFQTWRATVDGPVAGLNVSGLLFNQAGAASEQYGLHADYRRAAVALIDALVRRGAGVLLVSHVVCPVDKPESDRQAGLTVLEALPAAIRERVVLAPSLDDPCQTKWLIANTDWFCGARMHATIAALSSEIPTSAIAYSAKTGGVFETCGQGHRVVDARSTTTNDLVPALLQSWDERDVARSELAASMPSVVERARSQMEEAFVASQDERPARSRRVRVPGGTAS